MADEHRAPPARSVNPKMVAILVLAVVLIVFGLVNTNQVNVDFIVASVDVAMIVVIVVSAVVGFGLGWLVARHRGGG
jgi:lipopolysaccharide assembly protein A